MLSELSGAWRRWLRRWSVLNRSYRTELEGESAPARADEYHFYQALLAIWPPQAVDEKERESLRERLKTYMLKAVREAKVHTSWINPDTQYEQALERFVSESLANPLFLKDLADVVPRFAHLGLLVSLSLRGVPIIRARISESAKRIRSGAASISIVTGSVPGSSIATTIRIR